MEEFENTVSAKKSIDVFERADKLNQGIKTINCRYCKNRFTGSSYKQTVEIYERHLLKVHGIS